MPVTRSLGCGSGAPVLVLIEALSSPSSSSLAVTMRETVGGGGSHQLSCTATATAAAWLGACLTLCSVCFSRVSDSLYSLVLLLRNKLPEDEEWPHFQNVHHCLKKKTKNETTLYF